MVEEQNHGRSLRGGVSEGNRLEVANPKEVRVLDATSGASLGRGVHK